MDSGKLHPTQKPLKLLEKIIQLKIKYTDLIGYEENPYDALLDDYEPELKYGYIKPLFYMLENELSQILKKICQRDKDINDDFLLKTFDKAIFDVYPKRIKLVKE